MQFVAVAAFLLMRAKEVYDEHLENSTENVDSLWDETSLKSEDSILEMAREVDTEGKANVRDYHRDRMEELRELEQEHGIVTYDTNTACGTICVDCGITSDAYLRTRNNMRANNIRWCPDCEKRREQV